jgi:hypothetical protein
MVVAMVCLSGSKPPGDKPEWQSRDVLDDVTQEKGLSPHIGAMRGSSFETMPRSISHFLRREFPALREPLSPTLLFHYNMGYIVPNWRE